MRVNNDKFCYYPEFSYNCLRACMYNYLNIMGYEKPLYYIDTSIKLCDFKAHPADKATNLALYSIYESMMYVNFGNIEEVWEQDKKMLESGIPLIFEVDIFGLPFRKEYGKRHGSHGILCLGIAGEKLEIADWSKEHFFHDYVDTQTILSCRCSDNKFSDNPYSGKPINSYSLGVKEPLGQVDVKCCLNNWHSGNVLDFSVLENIRGKIENKEDIVESDHYLYILSQQIAFTKLFFNSLENKDAELIRILDDIMSYMQNLHIILLRLWIKMQDQYLEESLACLKQVEKMFRILENYLAKGV